MNNFILTIIFVLSFSIAVSSGIASFQYDKEITAALYDSSKRTAVNIGKKGTQKIKLFLPGKPFQSFGGIVYIELEKQSGINKTTLSKVELFATIRDAYGRKLFQGQLKFDPLVHTGHDSCFTRMFDRKDLKNFLCFHTKEIFQPGHENSFEMILEVKKPLPQVISSKQYMYARYSMCRCMLMMVVMQKGIAFIGAIFSIIIFWLLMKPLKKSE